MGGGGGGLGVEPVKYTLHLSAIGSLLNLKEKYLAKFIKQKTAGKNITREWNWPLMGGLVYITCSNFISLKTFLMS